MNEKSITTITLKKINKKSVYQYIYEHRQTAKQQIVQDLTMGLSTVSQNLNVLEKEGLISRDGFFESTGGRKAHQRTRRKRISQQERADRQLREKQKSVLALLFIRAVTELYRKLPM